MADYRFTVKVGVPEDAEAAKAGTKLARGAQFPLPDVGNADGRMPISRLKPMAGRHGRTRLMAMLPRVTAGVCTCRRRRNTKLAARPSATVVDS